MKKIEKDKYWKSDELSDIIDILIDHISEPGSYWKRNVNPLNVIYKRGEFVNSIIKTYLDDCEIKWNQRDPSINISLRKRNLINKILAAYLSKCGLQ